MNDLAKEIIDTEFDIKKRILELENEYHKLIEKVLENEEEN